MQFIGSVGTGSPPTPPFLLPSSNLTFPAISYSPSSCIQIFRGPKKEERKNMLVTAKRQMGWHVGRELLLCLAHKWGCLPCVLLPGVWAQFAEPWAYDMLPPPLASLEDPI